MKSFSTACSGIGRNVGSSKMPNHRSGERHRRSRFPNRPQYGQNGFERKKDDFREWRQNQYSKSRTPNIGKPLGFRNETEGGIRNCLDIEQERRFDLQHPDRKFQQKYKAVEHKRGRKRKNFHDVNEEEDFSDLDDARPMRSSSFYSAQQNSTDAYDDRVAVYCSLSENSDIVAELLDFLLEKGGVLKYTKLITFGLLNGKFKGDKKAFKRFLKNYGSSSFRFFASDKTEQVKAITVVRFCPDFCKDPKSCEENCGDLHLCKFHVLSSCEMKKCKFGHKLEDDHNKQVLKEHNLHRLSFKNLRLLLRHVENRCGITVPVICRFYNGKGCDKPGKCPYLHVCQKYVLETCENRSCQLSHSLYENAPILKRYGLDLAEVHPGEILQLLKKLNETENLVNSPNRSTGKLTKIGSSFNSHTTSKKGILNVAIPIPGIDKTLKAEIEKGYQRFEEAKESYEQAKERFEQAKKQIIIFRSGEKLIVNFENRSYSKEKRPRLNSLESISSASTVGTDEILSERENTEEDKISSDSENTDENESSSEGEKEVSNMETNDFIKI